MKLAIFSLMIAIFGSIATFVHYNYTDKQIEQLPQMQFNDSGGYAVGDGTDMIDLEPCRFWIEELFPNGIPEDIDASTLAHVMVMWYSFNGEGYQVSGTDGCPAKTVWETQISEKAKQYFSEPIISGDCDSCEEPYNKTH